MAATYEPIASTTLGSASSSVTLSSIPSSYTDLRVIFQGSRSTSGANAALLQVNGDTGSNYSSTFVAGDGSVAASSRQSSVTSIRFLNDGISQTSPDVAVVDLFSYSNTNVYKTLLISAAGFQYPIVERRVGLWRSTSAISSITFTIASGASYAAGSTFSVYGIKAA